MMVDPKGGVKGNILFKRYDGEISKLAESARNTFGERANEEGSEGDQGELVQLDRRVQVRLLNEYIPYSLPD